ncbi:hypothetical protein JZ751_003457 [Albula glossodonta]|uniref:Glycosyltransferase 8 domain-containing protein 2 n=1 Tax=Albula glossodonta TaxID=121402 RepID=A0A8T2MVZ1_9TELE|nr:hypothetical protein JZ751_003457 [Albula glossodonta]
MGTLPPPTEPLRSQSPPGSSGGLYQKPVQIRRPAAPPTPDLGRFTEPDPGPLAALGAHLKRSRPARPPFAQLISLNRVLLMLLILMVYIILYSKVHKVQPQPGSADESDRPETAAVHKAAEQKVEQRQVEQRQADPRQVELKVEAIGQVEDVDDGSILVVICASRERMGAAMTTINSVRSNTQAKVLFYIVTLRDSVAYARQYIEKSDLKDIKFKILEFNPMILKGKIKTDSSRPDLKHPLNFVRFYLPLLVSGYKKVIYLDDDIIVQGTRSDDGFHPPPNSHLLLERGREVGRIEREGGDIQDLYNTKLDPGHAAAFATDCDLPSEVVRSMGMQVRQHTCVGSNVGQTTYMGFLDYRREKVRELGMNPSECSFNPGVIVANVEEWRQQRITKQLENCMQDNVRPLCVPPVWFSPRILFSALRDNLYSNSMAGGVATPPMLVAFYQKYSDIDPSWHVGHLGWSPDTWYSESFLQEANLLHWNGRFKPWDFPSVYMEMWERWFVPDPTGRFMLVRSNG